MDQQIELGAAVGSRVISSPTEAVAGRSPYLDVLSALHRALKPRLYFEIGVRLGKSLALATCDAIGVDPNFAVSFQLSAPTRIYKMPSDDFFRDHAADVLKDPIDLAFIDGQHWFEFTLRDFINIERYSTPFSVIVFDDIFPNHPIQASRDRQTSYWTGDVWKIVSCLRRYRPDLVLVPLDASPTGLLLVMNLSPKNTVLSDHYDEIVRTYNPSPDLSPGKDVLARADATDPRNLAIFAAIERLGSARETETIPAAQQAIQNIACHVSSRQSTAEPIIFAAAQLPASRIAGSVKLIENKSPALEHVKGAYYFPPGSYLPDGGFGLFRADGTAVPPSIYLRSKGERPFNQPDRIDLANINIDFDRFDGPSYFIGPLVMHYGHFTIEVLSRLWALSTSLGEMPNILYHGYGVAETFARCAHVRILFSALGIGEEKLRRIERPTFVSEVLVAEAAIQPRRYVFGDIRNLYERLGRLLLKGTQTRAMREPIYLSKSNLMSGVGKVLNEYEIEDVLQREGVRIVHPEGLDLVEQVRLINSHGTICGIAGSAMHTTLFALDKKRLVYLVPNARINSNFVNIDLCKKHESSYLFCPSIAAGHSAFFSSYRIEQPKCVAELLLRELDAIR